MIIVWLFADYSWLFMIIHDYWVIIVRLFRIWDIFWHSPFFMILRLFMIIRRLLSDYCLIIYRLLGDYCQIIQDLRHFLGLPIFLWSWDYSWLFVDYWVIIAGRKCDIYITQREVLASSIEILGVYDYWRIIEKYPWLLADYSHKSDYLKIIAGGKCDIYITQREALASSIEKCWMTVWLSGDYL